MVSKSSKTQCENLLSIVLEQLQLMHQHLNAQIQWWQRTFFQKTSSTDLRPQIVIINRRGHQPEKEMHSL